jgi:SAM-dependent methyltransferase
LPPPDPRHPPDAFRRLDETPDAEFYAAPRFVTHIDDEAIAAVTQLYRERLPAGGAVLDLMSSWVSHLPPDVAYGRVIGLGMNADELAANPRLDAWIVHDLNAQPRLPFADGEFDALTFTYLLRYVDDPATTVAELVRVLRPGGVMASLEFHVPPEPWARAGWLAYTRSAMPLVGWTVSNEWYRTGRFLARSITEFVVRNPLPVQVRWWQEAGMRRVRTKLLSNGAAVVTWAVKTTPVLGDESEDLAHPDG